MASPLRSPELGEGTRQSSTGFRYGRVRYDVLAAADRRPSDAHPSRLPRTQARKVMRQLFSLA